MIISPHLSPYWTLLIIVLMNSNCSTCGATDQEFDTRRWQGLGTYLLRKSPAGGYVQHTRHHPVPTNDPDDQAMCNMLTYFTLVESQGESWIRRYNFSFGNTGMSYNTSHSPAEPNDLELFSRSTCPTGRLQCDVENEELCITWNAAQGEVKLYKHQSNLE